MTKYAEVIINSEALEIDRPFTYKIPNSLDLEIQKGFLVKVPFGMKNKPTYGFVLDVKDNIEDKGIKFKEVKEAVYSYPILGEDEFKVIEFIKENYLCRYIDAIRLFIPNGILKGMQHKNKKVVIVNDVSVEKSIIKEDYRQIVDFVRENSGIYTKSELVNDKNISLYKLNKLLKEEHLLLQDEIVSRINNRKYNDYFERTLTEEQRNAITNINNSHKNVTLLKGVTGSGKTEIYLRLVKETLEKGKGAIILVPEISLTPQMIERFKGRFGTGVAVFHSKLSDGERFDEWFRVKEGIAKVVIGARSALFLPITDLGIIIIDEEHENTYKSEHNPKYQTKEVAEFIVNLKNCKLILGSATPAIETFYRSLNGEINLIELKKRVDNSIMPKMNIVDMRNELKSGNLSLLSKKLYEEMNIRLEKKEQIILFLNRRGFSTFVSCRSCGYVFACPKCDISMTYHKNGYLICHYCGYGQREAKVCPKCQSKYVKYFGAGTERVEEEIKKYFPKARTLRMDVDTTRSKESHEKIYNSFKNGEADILIGTQMISKGLDFENVTLVGVLAADMSINIPDYRSGERTFQIITQVGGRAGRGEKEGEVIIQTYTPEHYSLKFAVNYDYEGLYNHEFTLRAMMEYPPFGKLLMINGTSKNNEKLKEYLNKAKLELTKITPKEYLILGPVPCIITRIKENYRWQILIKGELTLEYCKKVKELLYESNKNVYNEIRISLDINPNNMT